MKKSLLSIALLAVFALSVTSCRETKEKTEVSTENLKTEMNNAVKDFGTTAKQSLNEVVKSTKEATNDALDAAKQTAEELAKETEDAAKGAVESVKQIGNDAIEGTKNTANDAIDSAAKKLKSN